MGLFGKSHKEKEAEEQAKHREAQRKMQEALKRREQAAAAAKPAAAPAPAAKPAAAPPPAAPKPQAVPVAQPAPADGESYTVQKGDSLSKIAKKHLGDANAWNKIYEANKAVIGDNPDKIFPGQKLKIPGGGARNA